MNRIIVIDDMYFNLEFFQDILKSDFKIETFSNPRIALAEVLLNPPDLVLVDCVMPELDGFEVFSSIRSKYPNLPIIMTSGYRIEDNVIKAMDLLIDDFIYKPIEANELIARIKNKINKYRNKSIPTPKHTEYLEFNDEQELIKLDHKEIKLKSKEYNLLKYLVQNKNQIVTREEIFINVWNDISVSGATLEKYGDNIVTKKHSGFLYTNEIQSFQ
jgi:two-component system alkaline phosphatase synthesis response regulator PhoP